MRISFVSCVNDFAIYDTCVAISLRNQQEKVETELIPIDNTSSNLSAAAALNWGLNKAKGDIVVFCHQDVIFPPYWLSKLLEQISVVEEKFENWGVLGTFGVAMNGKFVGNVVDPHNSAPSKKLPIRVQSLDEHCLIIRKDSGLRFDEELDGFHFYGTDLCLQALAKGMSNFAIDACVEHLSAGKMDMSFYQLARKLCQKWNNADCSMSIIETTCGIFRIKEGLKARVLCCLAKGKRSWRRRKKILLNRLMCKVGLEETKSC